MKDNLMIKLKDDKTEEVLKRNITKFGSGAHVVLPKKHEGKIATIIIEK